MGGQHHPVPQRPRELSHLLGTDRNDVMYGTGADEYIMGYGTNDGAVPSLNDHRMWRLLLARLHPDAGGDHELFVFASTVKDSVCGKERLEAKPGNHTRPRAEPLTVAYLRLWQTLINPWSYADQRSKSDR